MGCRVYGVGYGVQGVGGGVQGVWCRVYHEAEFPAERAVAVAHAPPPEMR